MMNTHRRRGGFKIIQIWQTNSVKISDEGGRGRGKVKKSDNFVDIIELHMASEPKIDLKPT